MNADCSTGEVGVFIDTTLRTRIALSVPPDVTAELLISEIEKAHFTCLPSFGEIKVRGLMVKHKSCFYHLSLSAPSECALRGNKGPWFLHAAVVLQSTCSTMSARFGHDASLVEGCHPYSVGSAECINMSAVDSKLEQKCKVIESNSARRHPVDHACDTVGKVSCLPDSHGDTNLQKSTNESIGFPMPTTEKVSPEENFGLVAEDCSSGNSSTIRSLTDIITRCCSVTNTLQETQSVPEKKLTASRLQFCVASPVSADMTQRFILKDAGFGPLSSECKRPDVGQRLLMASSRLGISPAQASPVISMYRSKVKKQLGADVHIRHPIFELSENSS
uniref:Uncharacterized protein n=1 Tax=Kalanchoe fedtschenkoi TaxID=63787 RepID=A0A7N0TFP5_KALFE